MRYESQYLEPQGVLVNVGLQKAAAQATPPEALKATKVQTSTIVRLLWRL
jgi:hypothetical protein